MIRVDGKISVLSMNPCVDITMRVRGFVYGGLNRVEIDRREGSGKAINVACELAKMGAAVLCVGVNFAENGELVEARLREAGAEYDFVTLPGKVRENIKMYDEDGVMTELNTLGTVPFASLASFPPIPPQGGDLLVISGALPMGLPDSYYTDIVQSWPGRAVLDCAGEALKSTVSAEKVPYAIKPNLYELNTSFGADLTTKEEVADFCRTKLGHIPVVCCSMGRQGAVLVADGRAFFAEAPRLTPRRLHGAGDAMVAGLAYAITRGATADGFLPAAMAAVTNYMA